MVRIGILLAASASATACSMTPIVTKTSTTMTPREIREAGLECRQLVPIDSNIPRTLCATDAAWANYEERARRATDELLARGRELGNGFGRP